MENENMQTGALPGQSLQENPIPVSGGEQQHIQVPPSVQSGNGKFPFKKILLIVGALVLVSLIGLVIYRYGNQKSEITSVPNTPPVTKQIVAPTIEPTPSVMLVESLSNTPSPSPDILLSVTPIQIQTFTPPSSWKTYSNTTYGFSIQYPSQMTQSEALKNVITFTQGQMTICCGYEGPNMKIDIDRPEAFTQSPSDKVGKVVVNGTTYTKYAGLEGIRIGTFKQNGHSIIFTFSSKDMNEKDFGEMYEVLTTLK